MKLAYNSNMDLHTLDPIDAKTLNEFVDEESWLSGFLIDRIVNPSFPLN